KVTGWAVCRWVKPGITVSASASARPNKPCCKRVISPRMVSISSRSHRRMSVATWSLRLRPVCSFLPVMPMRSVRRASMFMCTSSRSTRQSNWPASISAWMSLSPAMIASRSSAFSTPACSSMVAWAIEPMMSWRYRRLSKSTEAVKRATKASTGSLKRPPQDWLVFSTLMGMLSAGAQQAGGTRRAAGMRTKRCANDSRVGPVAAAVQRCGAHHALWWRRLLSVRQIAAAVPHSADTVDMQTHWLNGAPRARLDGFFVPDLCEPEALLSLVLLAELLVLVLVLAEPMLHGFDWVRLALASLFVQWCVLLSAAVLCRLRAWLARLRPALAGPLCCLIVVVLTLGCTWVTEYFELGWPPSPEARLYLRHALISLIMSALLLRYFYLQSQWRRQQQAELQARIESLQARIRPHFLFNSLNSIASLVVSDPFKAEQAVLDLADLFRASLAKP